MNYNNTALLTLLCRKYAFRRQGCTIICPLSAGILISRTAFGITLRVVPVYGSIKIRISVWYMHGYICRDSIIRYLNPRIIWVALITVLTFASWIFAEGIPKIFHNIVYHHYIIQFESRLPPVLDDVVRSCQGGQLAGYNPESLVQRSCVLVWYRCSCQWHLQQRCEFDRGIPITSSIRIVS